MSQPPAAGDLAGEFDRLADRWDDLSGPASALAGEFHAHVAFLRGVCRRLGRPRVLDIGCGTGQHLVHLAPWIAEGTGIDFAPRMIERARANAVEAGVAHLRYRLAGVPALDRNGPERFDLALFIGTLEHIAEPAKALGRTRGVLAKGGRIVIIMPHRANLFFLLRRLRQGGDGRIFYSDSLYDVGRLRRLAASGGLSVESVHALPFLVERPGEPPVPLPWRILAAILGHLPTAPARGAFALVLRAAPEAPPAPGDPAGEI